MKTGKIIRRSIDFLMSVLLLCLMCYSRVGETLHEWLGLAITALFIAHHIINRKWIKSVYLPFQELFICFAAIGILRL